MANPHDAFFRFTFGQVDHVFGLLQCLLPAPLLDAVDRASLTSVATTATGPNLRLHHADLLFQAEVSGTDDPVFFLLEHKSGPDSALVRQLHRYVVHIVGEWQRAETSLPHVVPIVVHHGRKPLRGARWRPDSTGSAATRELLRFRPELPFLLDNLYRCAEADLLQRPMTALGRLTFLCLSFLPILGDDEALAALNRWGSLVLIVAAARGGQQAMEALSSYFLHVTDMPAERLALTVARILCTPTEGFVMSTADKLRAAGRAEGKVEGKTEGQADLLRRQLTARFGTIPAQFDTRLRTASVEDLQRWAIRILDAETLAEVFAHD